MHLGSRCTSVVVRSRRTSAKRMPSCLRPPRRPHPRRRRQVYSTERRPRALRARSTSIGTRLLPVPRSALRELTQSPSESAAAAAEPTREIARELSTIGNNDRSERYLRVSLRVARNSPSGGCADTRDTIKRDKVCSYRNPVSGVRGKI